MEIGFQSAGPTIEDYILHAAINSLPDTHSTSFFSVTNMFLECEVVS